jgi:prepilin-type N-terminal cleavage/methylation domain-containing protein
MTHLNFNPMKFIKQKGFTLIELSVSLIVIGLIIGAVTIMKDTQRSASYQRMSSDFVQAWVSAYERHYEGTGRPPGDSVTAPTGMVNGVTGSVIDGANLRNAMLAAGVSLPAGRAEGLEDRYVILDANGIPQDIQVSFTNVPWSEAGATQGTYVTRNRNVMVLNRLTPALAVMLDNVFDSRPNASFGKMREIGQHNITTNNRAPVAWSRTECDDVNANNTACATKLDETQSAMINAYILMSR